MRPNWPDELIHAIASRRAVLFFGSGISRNSLGKDGKTRPSGWPDLLLSATKRLGGPTKKIVKEVKRLITDRDYLTAAEVIKRQIGREDFITLLKAAYHDPDFRPAKIHDLLFLLDLRISITPNFDNIYEAGAAARGAGAITVKRYDEDDIADCLRRPERVVIKSHGSVSTPNHLIFTRADYAQARTKHSHFYELLDALLRTHTFFFVGCGLDDPDIRSLLEDYRYKHPFGQSHYFVMADGSYSPEVKSVLSDSLKVTFIEYAKTPDHANLTVGLEELVGLAEQKRIEIAGNQTW